MVTPQTNTTLQGIAELFLANSNFYVCGHVHPDGDCLGSTLGVVWLLKKLGKDAQPLIAEDATLDSAMSFLPGSADIINAHKAIELNLPPVDVFVCVDVPNESRLGEDATTLKNSAKHSVTIDHHAVKQAMSELTYTDPDVTSTTMLIWELAKCFNILDSNDDFSPLATCIYTGLLTDSGSFVNQNTNIDTFNCAAELVKYGANPSAIANNVYQNRTLASMELDAKTIENAKFLTSNSGKKCALSYITLSDMNKFCATDDDTENTVTCLRAIKGISVVCMLKERDGVIRGSFRAKDDTDVSLLANQFGGGGHKGAAGFNLDCSMDEALQIIEECLKSI